jgi:hypothetical protein
MITTPTADLIVILRRTLIELEQYEHPDSTVRQLKCSILRSIAEIETWDDSRLRRVALASRLKTKVRL